MLNLPLCSTCPYAQLAPPYPTCRKSKVLFEEKTKNGWKMILTPALNEDNHVFIPTIPKVCGRPPVNFNNAPSKTKRRRLSPLVASVSSSELLFAAGCSLYQGGGEKEAKAVLQSSEYNESNFFIVPYTPEKALNLDCGLSLDSYQQIRSDAVEAGCKLFLLTMLFEKQKNNECQILEAA